MFHEYCVPMNLTGITNSSTIKEINENATITPTTERTPTNENETKLEWCNLDKYDVIIKTRVKADT